MNVRNKIVVSVIISSLFAALIAGLPLGSRKQSVRGGSLGIASAAEAPPKASLAKWSEFHEALAAGDQVDAQHVSNLHDELDGLDDLNDQTLIDPIWNKMSLKLPAHVDKEKVKADLFRFFKAVIVSQLDPQASDLENIRSNADYRAALQAISAAAGQPSLTLEDFLIFLYGDGNSRKGLEGTVREEIRNMDPFSLMALTQEREKVNDLLFSELKEVLGLSSDYQVSRVFRNLGVTALNVQEMLQSFGNRLQLDTDAFVGIAVAYMRSNVKTTYRIAHYDGNVTDGRIYHYDLGLFGAYVLPDQLDWSKRSGSSDLKVFPRGGMELVYPAASAEALIQVNLLHPYGGPDKVILEKEMRHSHSFAGFPEEPFFARMGKLYGKLEEGPPSDLSNVRSLQEEWAALDVNSNLQLIDPIWNKLAIRFTAAQAEGMRMALFQLLKETAGLYFDPQEARLDAIRTNADYKLLLNNIIPVYSNGADQLLILLFGDDAARGGVQGEWLGLLAGQSPQDLIALLHNEEKRKQLLRSAIDTVFSESDDGQQTTYFYALGSALKQRGVTTEDLLSVLSSFEDKLAHSESAASAMLSAYFRSETQETAIISDDGLKHAYALSVLGKSIPAELLTWSKVSGSDAVTVMPDGVVTIPPYTPEVSAVIQAKAISSDGQAESILFQKEVTLKAADTGSGPAIPALLLERMNRLHEAIAAGGSQSVQNIHAAQEEIAGLDDNEMQFLIDPIWNKISENLPASVDAVPLKTSLFRLIKAAGALQYDPQASQLMAMLANPEYQAALAMLTEAGGGPDVTIENMAAFLYGDGSQAKGIEGTVRDMLAAKKPKEITALFANKKAASSLINQALTEVLQQSDRYALSEWFHGLGITAADWQAVSLGFQQALEKEKPAMHAWLMAYIRSEVQETVTISDNGTKHQYRLSVLGAELPSAFVKWIKLSGDQAVNVKLNGTVTLSNKQTSGRAVIQAVWLNASGGNAKVIFQKEVELVKETE
ncbi:hypothetical protein PAEN110709_23250 [Paenibacillus endophyticus]|uniref:hypothetical protein n=1 Tax=Paenibacillus endophyticus TaxID=1294268 RepID=UPI00160C121E|nr:hypothetical protein [Paenibacillus endophyticus]